MSTTTCAGWHGWLLLPGGVQGWEVPCKWHGPSTCINSREGSGLHVQLRASDKAAVWQQGPACHGIWYGRSSKDDCAHSKELYVDASFL
jgi:hypothetical protein